MKFSFTFGTFVGGVVSALLLGLPSPHSTLFSAVKWVTTLDDQASAQIPVLHYFDVRGRAEAIRLAFADKGVEYVEKNFTGDAWGTSASHNNVVVEGPVDLTGDWALERLFPLPEVATHLPQVHDVRVEMRLWFFGAWPRWRGAGDVSVTASVPSVTGASAGLRPETWVLTAPGAW